MRAKNQERGSALVETAILMFPLTLVFLGVTTLGFDLATSVHSAQVTRDVGSMYVRGVNFTVQPNQELVVRLAQGLGMTRDSNSEGVMYLSKVTFISQATCTALTLSPCNANRLVVTQRITLGNPSLRTSSVAVPDSRLINADGLVANYKQEPSAVATLPGLVLPEGEYAFVTEAFFDVPHFSMWGASNARGVYNRVIF